METIVIIGGNRGIGLGFVRHYLSQSKGNVIATYRDATQVDELKRLQAIYTDRLQLHHLDVRDETAITHFATTIHGPIALLILNAGIMRGGKVHPPSNTLQQARELMEVNVYAHDTLMRALYLKLLHPHSCAVYISSTLSHSGSNLRGGSHYYRASKAAANLLMQNWNIELARLWLESEGEAHTRPCVFPISPGVVRTDMAGPGSKAPLSVEESVQGMTSVIAAVRQHKQCSLYLYNGEILEQYPEPWIVSEELHNNLIAANKLRSTC